MKTVIRAQEVGKTYGKKQTAFEALRWINLEIKQGESVAIIGKSGSGKSTLMHILSLMDKQSTGKIYLKGEDISNLSSKKIDELRNKEFGFVFQQFFLNTKESVLENVSLPLKIAGISKGKRKQMALDVLKQVDLEDKAKNKAGDLSGGQKQRVCIARALVNQPKIIFADEPTGNLDSSTGEIIENLLFTLNQEKNITLIIVTHDEDLARKCDRQIRIVDGQIVSVEEK